MLDIESSNGTMLNGERIKPARYYELKSGDSIGFGFSKREFVFLGENEVEETGKKKKKKSKRSRRRHSSERD